MFWCEAIVDVLTEFFAVRWFVLSLLTLYTVLCRRVLWSVIFIMCSGARFDVSGVGRAPGMCVIGRLLVVMFAAVAFTRLA